MIEIFEKIISTYKNSAITTSTIISVLFMVLVLSIYEFIIYRFVSKRNFYNKSFNITIAVLPFFISTIILCLQSNIIVTLGTIGALAIIRFRTAVKDPTDMLYLLWSVYIGIICGCQLFEVGVLTSLIATFVLFFLEHINFGKKPLIVILNTSEDAEKDLTRLFKEKKIKSNFKSRNYTKDGYDYAIEVSISNVECLKDILDNKIINKYSIIDYDTF